MTALVRKESVEELCAHRERAIELYRQSVIVQREANDYSSRAIMRGPSNPPGRALNDNERQDALEKAVKEYTLELDRSMWRGFMEGTMLTSLMDKQERGKFMEMIEKGGSWEETGQKDRWDNPVKEFVPLPPATADNVWATLERLMGEADLIFRRGLVNVFAKLCRDYKSNDGFKIGERIVCTYGVTCDRDNWWSTNYNFKETLHDMDRVLRVLDGEPPAHWSASICSVFESAVGEARRGGVRTCEDKYWRLKFHKNGNVHLWIKSDELRTKANKIIAEWFGETLGAGHSAKAADPTKEPEIRAEKFDGLDANFFATPTDVIVRMLELAEIEDGMRVLEPSAGQGDIAVCLRNYTQDVWCVELDASRAAMLRSLGFVTRQGDFLAEKPERRFDRVLMNPPFSNGRDVAHVIHALKFLKPGGRLVAVMANAVTFRETAPYPQMRKIIERLGGSIEELPAGSFKDSGTGVSTVLVTLNAPTA